jgi:hypothetical protein
MDLQILWLTLCIIIGNTFIIIGIAKIVTELEKLNRK